MIIKKNIIKNKNNLYTSTENSFMNMDVSIILLKKDEEFIVEPSLKENAIDLLVGEIEVELIYQNQNQKYIFNRKNVFHDKPSVILIDRSGTLKIKALKNETEILLQSTFNDQTYGFKIFEPKDIKVSHAGLNESAGVVNRKIMEFFSHETMPQSNLVLGEVICSPGQWASWPPHRHYQPEMYLFKFNKPEGFGVSFVGDECYKVMNDDAICIPGQLLHPTVSAPGFIMWYAWMIPNLEKKPWVERNFDLEYEWTRTNEIEISSIE